MLGSDGSGLRVRLLWAATAALPLASADLPDVSWSSVPRRALLQNDSHRAVNTTNQLVVLAGLLSGLVTALVIITCVCLRNRLGGSTVAFNRGPADGRSRAAAQQQERQQAQQQAKLQQLPFVVIMPGNEVSYAQKLCPQAADAAAPGHKQLQLVPVTPVAAAKTAADDAEPPAAGAQEPQMPPSGGGLTIRTSAPGAAPDEASAAADAGDAGTAAATAAPAAGAAAGDGATASDAGSSVWGRLRRHYSDRAAHHAAEREAHRQREAAWIQRRAEQLGWAPAAEPVSMEVQQLPAFIEWDVTGSEGPILHPLPAPEEPAPPTPAANAALRVSSDASGSGRGGGRVLHAARFLADTLSAAPHSVLDSPSSRQMRSASRSGYSIDGAGGSGGGGSGGVGGGGSSQV